MTTNSIQTVPFTPVLDIGEKKKIAMQSIGSRIRQKAEYIAVGAIALKNITEFASNRGTRLVCGTTTVAAGLANLWSGNWFTGGIQTIAGGSELLKIFGNNYDKSEVSRLIGDAKAGVEMIQTLEEANKKSFEVVDANLDLVSQNVDKLTKQLSEIKSLASDSSKELENQKTLACNLYQEADELFAQAQKALHASRGSIDLASKMFTKALGQFDQLIQSAQSEEGDFEKRLKDFADSAQIVHKQCVDATDILGLSGKSYDEGLKILQTAIEKHNSASFEAGKAIQMAADSLKAIEEKAVVENDSKKEIGIIKQELSDVKARDKIKAEILSDVVEDLDQALELNEANWGTFSMMMGAVGTVAATTFVGPVTGVAAFPAVAKAVHDRKKIGDFLFGADPVPVPATPTPKNPVSFEYKQHSTGFWGRYIQKRQSYTAGKVAIDLGNEKVSYDFNLNNKSRIGKKDLKDLTKRLSDKLKAGLITPEYCEQVIQSLETVKMDRSTYHKQAVGFVAKNNSFFATLKLECQIAKRG